MTVIPIKNEIQSGDSTQIQGQLITCASFKPIKRIVNAPQKLAPPKESEEEFLLMVKNLKLF